MPRVRLDGGVIGVTNNPTSASAGGMWSFSEHSKYTRSAGWPAATAAVGTINASALVIAGGGGGGSTSGGGGGAGGYISNNLIQILNTTNYSITVGAGGAAGTSVADAGNGSNSTFSSLTAVGGGGGGNASLTPPGKAKGGGLDGGSGGGGSFVGSGTSGGIGGSNTVGQGYAGGNGWIAGDGNGTYAVGGGGGGASAVGATGTQNVAGNGGAGTSSSITGTSTSYAGGGGGGVNTNAGGTRGTGGTGGGGSGGNASTASSAGTVNTGGGGGGAYSTNNGSAGGSGIVVINYPAPQQFTGGTITNVINAAGSNIVHTFTSSGSLNALGYSIDTYFPQTTLLLHGDGTVGANNTVFLDSSANTYIPAATGTTYSNYFNGSSDYLATPSTALLSPGTGDYTTEVWVRFNTIPSSGKGILNGQASYTQNIYYDGGTYNTNVLAISNRVSNPILYSWVPTANTWYHIAVSRASSTLRLFINGTLVANTTDNTNYNGTASHTIGGDAGNGAGWSFPGYISNLRVVTGTALYTASFTPPTAPLTAVAGTQLLTSQSARFVDNSNNNLTITQTGGPLISSGGVPVATNGKPQQGTFSPFSQTGWSNYLPAQAGGNIVTPSNSAFGLPGVFTLEFFFNASSLTAGSITGVYSAGGFNMYYDGTRITPNLYGTGNIFNSTFTSITLGKWYHIVVRRDSNNLMTMYVDGVSVGSTTTSTTYTTGTWAIGNAFPMYISNLRITNTDVYGGTPTVPLSPLTAVTGTQLLTCQDNRFKDNSTNAFALTLAGTPQVQPFSPFSPSSAYSNTAVGGSISFNGSTDYLSGTGDPFGALTGNFTVEFWVYKNDAWGASSQMIFDAGASSSMGVWVNTGSGTLRMSRSGVDAPIEFSYSTLAPKQWYHIVFVRSGTTLSMYINGTRVNSVTSSASFAAGTTFNIGRNTGNSQYWNGYISNFRAVKGSAVYDPTLTTLTVPTAPLTAVNNTSLLLNATNTGVIDNTGKNVLTTYGSAAISSTQSKFGGTSMYFNGTTDYIQTPMVSTPLLEMGAGDYTVEFWFYALNNSDGGLVFKGLYQSGATWQPGFGVRRLSATQLRFTFNTSGSAAGEKNYDYTTTTNTNQWYHVAMVVSGGVGYAYVNGTLANPGGLASIGTITASSTGITVGAFPYNLGYIYFNGYIDDVRISRYARYTTNFTPPTSTFLDR